MALFGNLCVNLRDFLCGVPKSTPPRKPLISLTLQKIAHLSIENSNDFPGGMSEWGL
jgi:hypothetical protein